MILTVLAWLPAALCVIVVVQHWRERRAPRKVRPRAAWRWYLLGFPAVVIRMRWTWRSLCRNADLSVSPHSTHALVSRNLMVTGRPVKLRPPRLGLPKPTRTGLTVRVLLHPGQTPDRYVAVAEAMAHAWRVHAVRVAPVRRGEVLVTATMHDPLMSPGVGGVPPRPAQVLSCSVGQMEEGSSWVLDLRTVPHWLAVGATRSGKSNWLSAVVAELAPQPVALVGIDLKGGLELSPVESRLSALAIDRKGAQGLLDALISEALRRMTVCRKAGVRNIWELPDDARPVPIVVLVDEIAELYLTDGSRLDRNEAAACSTALLRLAQLGAGLGVHLMVAAQRLGSELGPGVTALRAQLGGRVCHRVNDEATAVMALGDLAADAVVVAQGIREEEQGVAVTTVGGSWMRVRSRLITTDQARLTAIENSARTPAMPHLVRAIVEGGEDHADRR